MESQADVLTIACANSEEHAVASRLDNVTADEVGGADRDPPFSEMVAMKGELSTAGGQCGRIHTADYRACMIPEKTRQRNSRGNVLTLILCCRGKQPSVP